MQSPEKIRELTQLRDKIEQKIDAAKEELVFLEENLQTVDLLLKQSSFTKASSIQIEPEKPKPKEPATQTADSETMADMKKKDATADIEKSL